MVTVLQKKKDWFIISFCKGCIHFLTEQFEAGLGYRSLNTARGALSSLGLKLEQFSAGSHPLVVRFLKGVYNLRHMRSRYCQTWSADIMLNYLRKLSPVRKLSMKELSLKLVMLVALTNVARVQTIHLFSVNSFTTFNLGVCFSIWKCVETKPAWLWLFSLKAESLSSRQEVVCIYHYGNVSVFVQ